MNNFNHDLFKKMGGADGIKNAVENGEMNKVLASLDADTAAKIKSVIADKDAAERLLKSPKAQEIMKMFLKGNK